MPESDGVQLAIQNVIKDMMDSVMNRVLRTDPFIADKHKAEKPLYAALVPDEVFKGSHFERRFVTSFGSVWEKLAVVAARTGLGFGIQGKLIEGKIRQERLRRITEILNALEHSARGKDRQKPDWDSEIAYILEGGGQDIPVSVICDVYAEETSSQGTYAFELKSPLPNSDITKVSKEKLLKLHSMEPRQVDGAYFALPYNPYGTRQNYSWSFPARWFDMKNDTVVLIGDDFWNKVGGAGTYKAFIDAVNAIGDEYKEQIYREYLGIEPPPDAFSTKLR